MSVSRRSRKAPPGTILNHDGYLRIKARKNGHRDQMAHRAYVARQMGIEKLPSGKEVHHVCMNRACFPPSDFHLCVCDEALAPYMYQTHGQRAARRNRKRNV